MPHLDVAGERIFFAYRPSSSPHTHNLILIHGAGGTHQHWGHQIRSIRTAAIYALDLPGHGRSSGSSRETIEGYAHFTTTFMNTLHLEQATIAGHSMGGAVALWLARHRPKRVEGLVLVGSGARLRVLRLVHQGLQKDFGATVEFIVRRSYGQNASAQELRRGWEQMKAVTPRTLKDDFAACDAFDMMDALPFIHQLALVVTGTRDAMTPPEYATYLHENLANARLVLVDGAGHMAMMQEPQIVTEAICDFLDSLPSSPDLECL